MEQYHNLLKKVLGEEDVMYGPGQKNIFLEYPGYKKEWQLN